MYSVTMLIDDNFSHNIIDNDISNWYVFIPYSMSLIHTPLYPHGNALQHYVNNLKIYLLHSFV